MKEVVCSLGRLDVLHMVHLRRLNFIKRSSQCHNKIMKHLITAYLNGPELKMLEAYSNVDINWSFKKLRALTFIQLKSLFIQKLNS